MIPLKERRSMIEKFHKDLSISKQFELLEVKRSGYYYEPVPESEENLNIMQVLDKQYLEAPFYGVERLLIHLILLGFRLNRKRLRRLMNVVCWRTIYPEPRTTRIDKKAYKYPYLLKDLEITKPNQVWAIDITYLPMQHGYMYLFAIIDLRTRFVVGWDLSNTMTAEWCVNTIQNAINEYGKPEIMNSDQGSQFTSELYTKLLQNNGIQISMDGKGRAIDNIFIERLWRSVKQEYVYLHVPEDSKELWQGLDNYFDFYNNRRPHQSLEYKTPDALYKSAA